MDRRGSWSRCASLSDLRNLGLWLRNLKRERSAPSLQTPHRELHFGRDFANSPVLNWRQGFIPSSASRETLQFLFEQIVDKVVQSDPLLLRLASEKSANLVFEMNRDFGREHWAGRTCRAHRLESRIALSSCQASSLPPIETRCMFYPVGAAFRRIPLEFIQEARWRREGQRIRL